MLLLGCEYEGEAERGEVMMCTRMQGLSSTSTCEAQTPVFLLCSLIAT